MANAFLSHPATSARIHSQIGNRNGNGNVNGDSPSILAMALGFDPLLHDGVTAALGAVGFPLQLLHTGLVSIDLSSIDLSSIDLSSIDLASIDLASHLPFGLPSEDPSSQASTAISVADPSRCLDMIAHLFVDFPVYFIESESLWFATNFLGRFVVLSRDCLPEEALHRSGEQTRIQLVLLVVFLLKKRAVLFSLVLRAAGKSGSEDNEQDDDRDEQDEGQDEDDEDEDDEDEDDEDEDDEDEDEEHPRGEEGQEPMN